MSGKCDYFQEAGESKYVYVTDLYEPTDPCCRVIGDDGEALRLDIAGKCRHAVSSANVKDYLVPKGHGEKFCLGNSAECPVMKNNGRVRPHFPC